MNYLIIYASGKCNTCIRVINSAMKISKEIKILDVKVKNLTKLDGTINVSPAIFLNNKLFCYEDIERKNLLIDLI